MSDMVTFEPSRITREGVDLLTGRWRGEDVIVASGQGTAAEALGLADGQRVGDYVIYPASSENMVRWETLAPTPRLAALHQAGYRRGFGAGNRIVLSQQDIPHLRAPQALGGWEGIHRAMAKSQAPFWYIQQSIVRELIPEGADPQEHPGIGHTGGYGPRELLRAGLFAFASQGGYAQSLPIGADADHAIIVGRDEATLEGSLAFNKLAIDESREYTKFTVDTSHLFGFSVSLGNTEQERLLGLFQGRRFHVENVLSGQPGFTYAYDQEEILRLGRKYWRACAVHQEVYDHVAALKGDQPFDYELSLDETPEATPPRDLLFYLVLLTEGMGVPGNGVASAGPNIGFIKRHDYEGDVQRELWPQVNACASILGQFGAILSVHSADGVQAATGKGPGVDQAIREATGGDAELKVADVYQEVLWQVLARSPEIAERELFLEAWHRTFEAVEQLSAVYAACLLSLDTDQARELLSQPERQREIIQQWGSKALAMAQGTIGYGLPVFRLAHQLLAETDRARPDPDQELFRRFMFLTFRDMRWPIFEALGAGGWERLAEALDQATMVRLEAMGWA